MDDAMDGASKQNENTHKVIFKVDRLKVACELIGVGDNRVPDWSSS